MCTIQKKTATTQQQQNLTEKWKRTWIDFFTEYTNGQKIYEKKPKIIHHYGNENQKHVKLTLHLIVMYIKWYLLSDIYYQKRRGKKENNMLVRM